MMPSAFQVFPRQKQNICILFTKWSHDMHIFDCCSSPSGHVMELCLVQYILVFVIISNGCTIFYREGISFINTYCLQLFPILVCLIKITQRQTSLHVYLCSIVQLFPEENLQEAELLSQRIHMFLKLLIQLAKPSSEDD